MLGLVRDPQTRYLVRTRMDVGDDVCNPREVLLRVDASRDGEPDELEPVVRVGPVLAGHDPPLHRPDAACEVEGRSKRLGRELRLLEVGDEPLRVDEHGVGADRHDDGHVGLLEQRTEVARLRDIRVDDALVGRLPDPLSERLHVVPGHASVVREALVDDDLLAEPPGELEVVHRDEAADGHEVILLGAEDRAVGVVCDQADELARACAPRTRAPAP